MLLNTTEIVQFAAPIIPVNGLLPVPPQPEIVESTEPGFAVGTQENELLYTCDPAHPVTVPEPVMFTVIM